MPEQWFKVELLSDIVITADAATTGGHQGLDYLPGSLFLGAAVAAAGTFNPELFLSGKVRFLDGLVASGEKPTFPIPLAFHKIKGQEWKGQVPLNLLTQTHQDPDRQPKQWRGGYMDAGGHIVEIETAQRMKTAVDREKRRSAEGNLFGYQSIPAGLVFFSRLQADSAEELARVTWLFTTTTIRLGKSRSAEYGAARMTAIPAPDDFSPPQIAGQQLSLYLLSDLALLRDGMPVLLPAPADFGLPADAELDPEKTFLRVRRYVPWNANFNCRMADRQVLCKGGVITFRLKNDVAKTIENLQVKLCAGIGMHREEGLGQLLVNPSWLLHPPILNANPMPVAQCQTVISYPDTPLVNYLRKKSEEQKETVAAFKQGLSWASEWYLLSKRITKEHGVAPGKTQWSNIREIATRCLHNPDELANELAQFCGESLRRKLWVDASIRAANEEQCLKNALMQKINSGSGNNALALHYAAIEMSRLLERG